MNRTGREKLTPMNPNTLPPTTGPVPAMRPQSVIPMWLKIAYTAFVAVLIPVYWANYGPTNFLYFCDVALLITLYACLLYTSDAADE